MTVPDVPALLAAADTADPAIRARLNLLVNAMLDEVEHQMRHGTPMAKAALLKTAVPAILKELREEKVDDEIVNLRVAMTELNNDIRLALTTTPARGIDKVIDLPTDTAKKKPSPKKKAPS